MLSAVQTLSKSGFTAKVLFDVGANRGETVSESVKVFPDAKIYAFEPVSTTFDMLADSHKENPNVSLNHMALNDVKGTVLMRAAPGNTMNSIITKPHARLPTESVEGETGDNYCREHGIDHIDFLKIDTEGSDLRVLLGFEEMIRAKKIRFVQVECSTEPTNDLHVTLQVFLSHMFDRGYGLYDLFDRRRDPKMKKQKIRNIWYCNALFMVSRPDTL